MATARLTILSLYKWQKAHDADLFSELVIPSGMNKDALINNIVMQSVPFEVYYPDPEVFTEAIGFWSAANIEKWNRWADSWIKASAFNQLENFDRTEHEEIAHSGTDESENTQTRNLTGSDLRTANLSQNETRNLADSRNEELKVSAYDSSSYAPKEQRTASESHTGTDNIGTTGTDRHDITDGGTVADDGSFTYGHNIERDARFHGNIGVTSLAQLLEGYNIAAEEWDLYARITQEFIQEFCILVY